MTLDPVRVRIAHEKAREILLAERNAEGFWVGELSASALSTATAIAALAVSRKNAGVFDALISDGLTWLADNQNPDGGWGDTVRSVSNISTTMLCRAALTLGTKTISSQAGRDLKLPLERCESWLAHHGRTSAELAEAVRRRYGKDRTFSVPILMMCALAELVPWNEVPRLPFELASIPQSWYRFARMPVVSYALPALIAIGQTIHAHRRSWNPYSIVMRRLARRRSLLVLERIQPEGGGFLEATPLTSFVVMSLASIPNRDATADRVIDRGIDFIVRSVRADGSWPIDTNLSIWVTTLSINALTVGNGLGVVNNREDLLRWLLDQQTKEIHPYTGAAPGAWGWSHLPGSVPDCDDTPGAMLALAVLSEHFPEYRPAIEMALKNGTKWMCDLQNRDGGFPTFCRGWGKLPFDRSGTDLTAHALRAIWRAEETIVESGFTYLKRQQRPDGSWLPLWFGNQEATDDINPVYGTSRVLAAYRDLKRAETSEAQRGIAYLLGVQNTDGGWGGARGAASSVEETALAVDVLLDLVPAEKRSAIEKGVNYLVGRVESGTFSEPSPIGFYFAKLWYFEKLYPIIFTVAALSRAVARDSATRVPCAQD